jgi:hypothetical protein
MFFFQVQTQTDPEGKLASRGNKTSLRVIQRYADTFEFQPFWITLIIGAFILKVDLGLMLSLLAPSQNINKYNKKWSY